MALEQLRTVDDVTSAEALALSEGTIEYYAPSQTDALALNDADAMVERFPNGAGTGLAELRAQAQRLSGAVVLPPSLG